MKNKVSHHFSAGVYAREFNVRKYCHIKSHKHNYDHMSILAKGTAIVLVDGKQEEYVAPTVMSIKSGTEHDIFAVEDCVWFCIHATEESNKDKLDQVLIQGE